MRACPPMFLSGQNLPVLPALPAFRSNIVQYLSDPLSRFGPSSRQEHTMTGLDLVTSAAKGGLGLVLLTASGYAQTHKELTMTQIATVAPAVAKDTASRPFRRRL